MVNRERAIIDIGSNTVRLVIYGGPARAPAVLHNEKVTARLGKGVAEAGRLSDKAMAQALAALRPRIENVYLADKSSAFNTARFEALELQNLLEVRGIGLLDIKAIFGETAVRRKMRLQLIVHLVRRETLERDYERMPYEPLYQDVLGVPVRKAVIQVVAGRNIAVLVEAAVRNTILQLRGIDTYQEFVARHRAAMSRGD